MQGFEVFLYLLMEDLQFKVQPPGEATVPNHFILILGKGVLKGRTGLGLCNF